MNLHLEPLENRTNLQFILRLIQHSRQPTDKQPFAFFSSLWNLEISQRIIRSALSRKFIGLRVFSPRTPVTPAVTARIGILAIFPLIWTTTSHVPFWSTRTTFNRGTKYCIALSATSFSAKSIKQISWATTRERTIDIWTFVTEATPFLVRNSLILSGVVV